jgi:hypothetical protein
MTKQQYLNTQIVLDFIEWISPKLDVTFTHNYVIHPSNVSWVQYNGGIINWNCTSIYDAFLQYHWKGSDFIATSTLLNGFEASLKTAIATNNNANIDLACRNILQWGGQRVFNPNYPKIQGIPNLSLYFTNNITVLNPNLFDDDITLVRANGIDIFNAGFTKIYSLCIDNFIIYDSRVGLALCNLISQFLIANGITNIPKELQFKIPPGSSQTRHPNIINGFRFGRTNSNIYNYQISNLRSSWLFEKILQVNPNSLFNTLPNAQRIRALEAAFFMIGYSI